MIPRSIPGILSVLLVTVVVGCDTAPGPPDLNGSAPVVSNLTFTPETVVVEALPDGAVQGGIASLTMVLNVDARDDDSDMDRVFIVVLPPRANESALAQVTLEASKNGRYEASVDLAIPVAAVGLYTVKVSASDKNGRLSNQVIGQFAFEASGGPPVIEEISMPDQATRPASGQPAVRIPIVATVSDPDGLANILRVEVVVNGSVTLQMCDDGGKGVCNAGFGGSGDSSEGDGKFTLTIELNASNAAGVNTFVFSAVDRTGLKSNTETRTITVN